MAEPYDQDAVMPAEPADLAGLEQCSSTYPVPGGGKDLPCTELAGHTGYHIYTRWGSGSVPSQWAWL